MNIATAEAPVLDKRSSIIQTRSSLPKHEHNEKERSRGEARANERRQIEAKHDGQQAESDY